eukprot:873601-Prymnesium_polylepis.1
MRASFALALPAAAAAATALVALYYRHRLTLSPPPPPQAAQSSPSSQPSAAPPDPTLVSLLAILREHPPTHEMTIAAIRRFLSRMRCSLHPAKADADLRFPVDEPTERAVHGAILAARDAGAPGFEVIGAVAEDVLAYISSKTSPAGSRTAVQLGVAVHAASRRALTGEKLGDRTTHGTTYFLSDAVEVREVAGERGFYARAPLQAGSLVLSEEPDLLEYDDDYPGLLAIHVLGRGLLNPKDGLRLSPHESANDNGLSTMSASAAEWLRHVEGVTYEAASAAFLAAMNNGWSTTTADGNDALLLYAKVALFNHSCWPTCARKDGGSGRASVYTVREVAVGEELTVSYSDSLSLLPTPLRRVFLANSFGFQCGCDRCSAPLGSPADSLLELGQNDPQAMHQARQAH